MQVVSVGRKPVPVNETLWPEPPPNQITGSDRTEMSRVLAEAMTNAQIKSVPMSLNGTHPFL